MQQNRSSAHISGQHYRYDDYFIMNNTLIMSHLNIDNHAIMALDLRLNSKMTM